MGSCHLASNDDEAPAFMWLPNMNSVTDIESIKDALPFLPILTRIMES